MTNGVEWSRGEGSAVECVECSGARWSGQYTQKQKSPVLQRENGVTCGWPSSFVYCLVSLLGRYGKGRISRRKLSNADKELAAQVRRLDSDMNQVQMLGLTHGL